MADGVDIDLYSDDIDQNFGQMKEDYVGDEDLYDDVVAAPSSEPHERTENENGAIPTAERSDGVDSNGSYSHGNAFPPSHVGRRHQLYVGNLTWWTTDQDITDAVNQIGVTDFQEVKFFENRANGQSKGFCVISLGSEGSMRMCMDRLGKQELHNQKLIVTLPTKAALAQFESQQKTRPIPPPTNAPRGPAPMQGGPMPNNNFVPGPQQHQPRMMMPNGPPGNNFRPQHMPPQNMNKFGEMSSMPPNQGPQRMQQPMMHQRPMGPQQGPPRFPNQNQWNNGPPRQNGPIRPGMPPQAMPPQHRPMFQNQPGGMPPRGPRGDWNRPPMHQGYQPPNGPPNQSNPQMMQGPPRGPPPQQMGGGMQQMPAPQPHVNPAFFNQNSGPPQHHPHHPNSGGMNQPQNMQPHGPQHFQQMDQRSNNSWQGPVKPQSIPPAAPFPEQPIQPQMSEAEFEEIMTRNRTVSSSAIARAVSDAAAGEYTSAIETLVTAISLIKQSKVAHDERCKILISSLQDTLHGIESKNYSRRERSRSRDRDSRSHRERRPRRDRSRERSSSRYRERSRERGGRDGRYYSESTSSYNRDNRERSRSRDRAPASGAGTSGDHYSESNSRSNRPRNKSPDAVGDPSSETSKRNYYDERSYNRSSPRERDRGDRDRGDREREHRSRH